MINFIEQIIAPNSLADFFDKIHEKDILHVKRNDQHYYDTILTSQQLSDFLDRQDIFYPSLRIVKEGKELSSSGYTKKGVPIGHHKKDGIIDTDKMFSLFNQGSTLVVQAGQRYFDNLSKCCMQLSDLFSSPVQANLYITPNKSQGFNPHWDTHDVFVLQISGTKTWQLYDFEMELPTKSHKFISKNYTKKPKKSLQLLPGDFLYVPRGYVHDAMADDGISAHITIGILSYTWARLFNEVFPQLQSFKEFREAVPFWDKDELQKKIQERTELLVQKIKELDMNKGLAALKTNRKNMQAQPVNNYFKSILEVNDITNATLFELNEYVIVTKQKSAEGVSYTYFNKTIELPLAAEPLTDMIFEKKKFRLEDLPQEIKVEEKLAILKLLIKEGLIYIQKP